MTKESKILIAVLVLVIGGMIGLFVLANNNSNSTAKTADAGKITRSTTHKEGSGSVQLVEFGDYECPACGRAYPMVNQLMTDYAGKVTLSFRNYPLTQIHPNAQISAQAAEAAALQNKFWEMHNKLYETQAEWSNLADPTDKFASYAQALGLDVNKFKQDLNSQAVKNTVAQDVADGNSLSINQTPTFYLNGVQRTDITASYGAMKAAVDQELSKK